ncbi:MAG: recombinase family protein [Roseiarcus sp.]|jgi:DNA invertase Pin-like site-specific DNA recombinase
MKPSTPKTQRCAIYTRVSTDQGLEQKFNSLHAQREAAQAYIKSQAHEGWKLIRDHYDDGGFSGGSMERPALQKLLADIKERRIDIVVVYKVDRLTRSLTDFAKLVELSDEHNVSFVSVTQSFNTTTSMGRLTLNVLLSFAQFEREVTGERIRDKIAASKKKGIWVGGVVPLGYEVRDKKLIVNDDEARTVRLIFERYLALGSLPALQRELRGQGIVTRKRTLSSGKMIGGVHLTNGPLAYMLRNRLYLGEINHRDQSYPGEHQPIIDSGLFDRVQARLDENLHGRSLKNERSQALLLGKLYDDRGNRMTPSYAIKKGVRYRYYVSCVLAQGRKDEAGSVSRVAASEIETIVMDALATLVPVSEESVQLDRSGPATSEEHPMPTAPVRIEGRPQQLSDKANVERCVDRIVVGARSIEIRFVEGAQGAARPSSITVPWRPAPFRRKRELVQPADGARPIRAEARGRLLAAIARGRSWLEEILSDQAARLELIAEREGLPERSARSILSLAFLAPDIVKAAVTATLPRGFGFSRLIDLPANWAEQRSALGLPERS